MKKIYYAVIASSVLLMSGCVTNPNTLIGEAESVTVSDAGDCLDKSRCDHPVDIERDVYAVDFEGNLADNAGRLSTYIATIEEGCRSLGPDLWGGDIDYIPIKAEPGTPLTIDVVSIGSSKMDPVLYLLGQNGGDLVFAESSYGIASISFLAPESLFYIRVEEYKNYNYYRDSCVDWLVGGDDYKYRVNIRKTDKTATSFGLLTGKKVFNAKIEEAGDVNYYKFSASSELKLEVVVTSNDENSAPVVSQIDRNTSGKTYAGGYQWLNYGEALNSNSSQGRRILNVSNADCSNDNCEYWFAVTDYDGHAGYDYQIELNVL